MTNLESNQDRRTFERFLAYLPAKIKDARQDFGSNIYLRNASAQGIKITNKEQFFLKDFLCLQVKVPGQSVPITLRGEVVWTRKSEDDVWETGVKFPQIPFVPMALLYESVS